ncbi:MFS transporter [Thermobispora bispora]|uniref:Major facilitator superfamily MFS_1 n=1 Tax=Thermobispora bispora (strain ATCC 19993 / DSM 43833 / CBS 139.67 / JCM 10125 / KCTC 9307 / NBRC 14880 / R51) TaxID=469371 RepID=D6Y7Q8_THEBD|nr:MFS transporter [Thermobispora bispora]MBO2473899.1 MFS transporter [Actinomycetales bacterium]MDI9580566.1 MFS transporter [Thermobispora sp.]ADG89769.1 major facilitator superfamily MFS_1 [Thermobispora bispora DSM 43833]MBX6166904.1 MFS transporter [Thermobispora bispora]QSI49359.1 MFS transporter [Thermobispora bispora]
MPHPRDRRARLATSAVFFVQGLTFAGLLTQVAALQRRHGLTDGELAILLLCVPLIAGAGSALVGALAARHGSRRPLRAVQLLICLAAIAAGFAPDTAVLLAAVAVFGLGLGGVDAGMNMQAVAVERRYGRPILTGFHAVWSGAAVLSALWASAAAGIGLGLGTTIAAVLGPAAMLALVASTRLYGPAEERELTALQGTPGPGDPPRHGAPAWRPLLPLCLVMAFLYVGDSAVANFGSVFMDQAVSAEPYLVPLALGAYQAATFAVRVAGDHAVRRFGPVAIVRAGAVIAAAGFTAIVTAPGAVWAITGFALTGIGLSVIAPQVFSAAGRLDPGGTGIAVARVNMFNYLGFIIGAALVGGLADLAGHRVAFAAPLALIAAVTGLARAFRSGAGAAATGSPAPRQPAVPPSEGRT